MADSVRDPRLDVPRKSVAAGLRGDRKPLAVEKRRVSGCVVERALLLANMTKQQASYEMGYPDQSAISRWIAETEPTQWHKLMAIDALRPWIPIAWAEQAGVDVQTTVTVRRGA